jgi:rhodanese-related sulfurtransferase
MVQSITPEALEQWQQQHQVFALLDVREQAEHDYFNIGGKLIPMGEVWQRINELPTEMPLVVYCQKGIRSAIVIQRLQEKFGWKHLYNLQGGMAAWQKMRNHSKGL